MCFHSSTNPTSTGERCSPATTNDAASVGQLRQVSRNDNKLYFNNNPQLKFRRGSAKTEPSTQEEIEMDQRPQHERGASVREWFSDRMLDAWQFFLTGPHTMIGLTFLWLHWVNRYLRYLWACCSPFVSFQYRFKLFNATMALLDSELGRVQIKGKILHQVFWNVLFGFVWRF